jgi:hypothetical protein
MGTINSVKELLEKYAAGERNFRGANLIGADLGGADLRGADLRGANLSWADLRGADLRGANLTGANLIGANLIGANLIGANLTCADLYEADLSGADLSRADLRGADLYEANLSRADLSGADLRGAYLYGTNLAWTDLGWANLANTCLDPSAEIPQCDLSEFASDGDYIIGYRTKKSQHCGKTIYETGNHYVAPYFSVDTETKCHPGIYLATIIWLHNNYSIEKYVKVKALKSETIKAGDKYRAKQIWVIEDYKEED